MRSIAGAVPAPILLITGGTAVVSVFMVVTGMGPELVLVAALGALVGLGGWFLVDVADRAETPTDVAPDRHGPRDARSDRRVERLRSALAHGRPDSIVPERLHRALVEIIDDQLRSAHHLERLDDPAAANAVVGDELQQFIDDPASAVALLRPNRLARVLGLLERL